jgi:hypothetical protein
MGTMLQHLLLQSEARPWQEDFFLGGIRELPDKTSHKPSLARIKHSSSGSLFVKVISGSAITTGFKYLSPAQKNITEEKELSKHFKNPCIQR